MVTVSKLTVNIVAPIRRFLLISNKFNMQRILYNLKVIEINKV